MAMYCPACCGRKKFCRKCKTAHCDCSWAKCPKKKAAPKNKKQLEAARHDA